MERFGKGDSTGARVSQGFRTANGLGSTTYGPQANQMRTATVDLRNEVRTVEDIGIAVTMAIARRDAAGLALTHAARHVRLRLTDAPEAQREEPYRSILPNGAKEFSKVPIGQVLQRFTNLVSRIERALAPTHPVRVEFVPVLGARLRAWQKAVAEVTAARMQLDRAKSALDRSRDAWDSAWCDVYAQVLRGVGRTVADRYFRRTGPIPRHAPGEDPEPDVVPELTPPPPEHDDADVLAPEVIGPRRPT